MAELTRSPKQLGVTLRRFRRGRALTQAKLAGVRQGTTQAELARRAGVRQGTVSQVETGLETVKLTTVMGLLRALDLEMVIQRRTKGSHSDIEDIF